MDWEIVRESDGVKVAEAQNEQLAAVLVEAMDAEFGPTDGKHRYQGKKPFGIPTITMHVADFARLLFNLNDQEEVFTEPMGGKYEGCTRYADKEDGGNWELIINDKTGKVVNVWFD